MTFQARETLVYREKRRDIRALPLHNCERAIPNFNFISSGCHRGYCGTWELQADTLHLVRLNPPARFEDDRDRLTEMFAEAVGSVEANWFSGEVGSDDEIDPKNESQIAMYQLNNWPLRFIRFTLIIHRGKLLSEIATDLQSGLTQARLTHNIDQLFPAEERGFLHAINANLDDFTAKLVYADWLADRDDPREELLRVEVARQQKEGSGRLLVNQNTSEAVQTGFVPPDNLRWYWCRLTDIPEPTPEDRKYRQFLEQWKGSG